MPVRSPETALAARRKGELLAICRGVGSFSGFREAFLVPEQCILGRESHRKIGLEFELLAPAAHHHVPALLSCCAQEFEGRQALAQRC